MADGLDVVAVRVEHVRRVVVRRHTGRGSPAGRCRLPPAAERRLVERVDRLAIGAVEGDVSATDGVAAPDPEVEPVRVREVREPPSSSYTSR